MSIDDDRALREYVSVALELVFADRAEAEFLRSRFHAVAVERVGVPVREQLLATIGVRASAEGLAFLARDLIESQGFWSAHRKWLLASDTPWAELATWVGTEAARAHRALQPKGAKKTLAGIAAASSRREIGPA